MVSDQNFAKIQTYIPGNPSKYKHLLQYSSTRKRILSLGSYVIFLLSFISCPVGVYYLLYGNNIIRILLIVILFYQYFLCKKWNFLIKLIRFFHPTYYFNTYGSIVDRKNDTDTPIINDEKSLFCFHPHGIIGISFLTEAVMTDFINKSSVCSSRGVIYTPFLGLWVQWFGNESVNNSRFLEDMKKGKNISLVPGGFEEATLTNYNADRLFIKERKGFIKYSLEYGYKVHPVFCFNENRLYRTLNIFEDLRLFLNKFKIPGVLCIGGAFGFLPSYNINRVTVYSSGIQFPLIKNPSKEEVNHYHSLYIKELEYIYHKYKNEFGGYESLEIN